MKFSIRSVAAAAAGLALAIGVGSASAAPTFTINPNAIPGNVFATAPFDATVFGGTSSELLHLNATGNSGFGWVQLNSVSNGSTVINPLASGLNVDYGLYLTFSLDATLLSGVNGAAGSKYALNTLNFQVWADKDMNTSFVNASSAGLGTEATVGGTRTDDILLGFGGLLVGTADLTGLGGAALNSINTFAVCDGVDTANVGGVPVPAALATGCTSTGASYFAKPIPFYELAFSGFNNASGGVHKNGDLVDVQDAVAALTFNKVPEPDSIALLGIALAGLGVAMRRGKKNKSV